MRPSLDLFQSLIVGSVVVCLSGRIRYLTVMRGLLLQKDIVIAATRIQPGWQVILA